jgi:hypothetical protein
LVSPLNFARPASVTLLRLRPAWRNVVRAIDEPHTSLKRPIGPGQRAVPTVHDAPGCSSLFPAWCNVGKVVTTKRKSRTWPGSRESKLRQT